MSTHCILGSGSPTNFRGLYSHSDGYPCYTGKLMWELLKSWTGTLEEFVAEYFEARPEGYSVFPAKPYSGSNERYWYTSEALTGELADAPAADWWRYLVDPEARALVIAKGDPRSPELLQIFPLDGPEPDWAELEAAAAGKPKASTEKFVNGILAEYFPEGAGAAYALHRQLPGAYPLPAGFPPPVNFSL